MSASRSRFGSAPPCAGRLGSAARGGAQRGLAAACLAFAALCSTSCGAAAPVGTGSAGRDAPGAETSAPPALPRLAGYAREVHGAFDPDRAMASVAYVDRYFRVRGNEGYQKTLDHVRSALAAAGFEPDELRVLQLGPVQPTWTPRAATLALLGADGDRTALVRFGDETERDRAALLVGSDPTPATELEVIRAEAIRSAADVRGRLVLAEGSPEDVYARYVHASDAAGLLVRYLEAYHRTEDNPDAAQFGYLPEHLRPVVGFSLSQRAWERLRQATEAGIARVAVEVDVERGASAATAVEARIPGADPDAPALVFVAHADEPGANDNASGVAALAELARALRLRADEGARPRRTMIFLWGQEIEVSRAWLEGPSASVGAGLVLDMVGEDPEVVGAPFLIERMPDPGAVWLRPPDEHTEWGASAVTEEQLRGHFLNDLLAASAAQVERLDGPWRWRTNPYEGGSDHVPFLQRGLPAVLGWHFTDSAYHTTLDRLDRVSGEEMRRVAATFGAAALAMASGRDADLRELLALVEHAAVARLARSAAAGRAWIDAGRSSAAEERRVLRAWADWYDEALASVPAWSPAAGVSADAARERLAEAARRRRAEL